MTKRPANKPIRVLVVEDSRAQRELLIGLLENHGFVVAGSAPDGQQAIAETERLQPDVIAMDINLPVLDGYEATRQIMQRRPTPIVMVSSSSGDEQQRSMRALAAGALTVVRKPLSLNDRAGEGDVATFLTTLRLMADVRVVTRFPARGVPPAQAPAQPTPIQPLRPRATPEVVAVAASTGGPAALQSLLIGIGPKFPLPILIAQHITRGFVASLIDWLNSTVPLTVKAAEQGERLKPGVAYLAPDDQHLLSRPRGVAALQLGISADRFCPSADMLFFSVAASYGPRAIGVILTGMGDDGARGMTALRTAGAQTLAQDQASCVVFGMPQAAIAAGAIIHVGPIPALANTIRHLATEQPGGQQLPDRAEIV